MQFTILYWSFNTINENDVRIQAFCSVFLNVLSMQSSVTIPEHTHLKEKTLRRTNIMRKFCLFGCAITS